MHYSGQNFTSLGKRRFGLYQAILKANCLLGNRPESSLAVQC